MGCRFEKSNFVYIGNFDSDSTIFGYVVDENNAFFCNDAYGKIVASDTVRVVFYKLSFQLSNAISQAIETIRREYKK